MALLLLVIFASHAIANIAAVEDYCVAPEPDHNNTEKYFNEHIAHRGDRHQVLVDRIKQSRPGLNTVILKLLEYTVESADSPFFRMQWEAMFRVLLVYGYSEGELREDNLCIFAKAINAAIAFENEKLPEEAMDCFMDLHIYLIFDTFYRIISNTLASHNCPTDKVPVLEVPSCYNVNECVDGGRNYEIDDVWDEFDENQKEHVAAGDDDNEADFIYPLIETLYRSEDLFENYVAALYTFNALQVNYVWKSKTMKSKEHLKTFSKISLFEEAIINVKPCSCDELLNTLIKKMNGFVDTCLISKKIVRSKSNECRTHGHLKYQKGKRGKEHMNDKKHLGKRHGN